MPPDARLIRRFLFERLLPYWRRHGLDTTFGGFHERLTEDGRPAPVGYKRLTVHCRQLFVFSHAFLLGDRDSGPAAAEAFALLAPRFRDPRHGGWWFSTTPEGAPFDRRKDSYAQAFVLFALGWYYRAFRDPAALALAEETAALLDRYAARADGEGLHDALTEDWQVLPLPYRQNPHMHLLEACLALHDATADTGWRHRAAGLVGMLLDRFLDPETGTLGEFFDADWQPHPVDGDLVEPGHHFEWCWLLRRLPPPLATPETEAAADRLLGFARRHGVAADGGVHDQLDRSGRVRLPSQRLWPLMESIKAFAVAPGDGPQGEAFRKALGLFFARNAGPSGELRERFDGTGRLLEREQYSSTCYHVVLALSEALRVLESPHHRSPTAP